MAGMVPAGLFLLWVVSVENAWHCLVEYNAQLTAWLPWDKRLGLLGAWVIQDRVLIWTGLAGCFLWRSPIVRACAVANVLGWALITAGGPALHAHHFSPLGPFLAVSAAALWNWGKVTLGTELVRGGLMLAGMAAAVFLAFVPHLAPELLDDRTPGYFELIEVLRAQPGKLFTIEPIHAIDSGKDIPMHYHAADMRVLRELKQNLAVEDYIRLIDQSQVVLIEKFANGYFPLQVHAYVRERYHPVFQHRKAGYVFVRNEPSGR